MGMNLEDPGLAQRYRQQRQNLTAMRQKVEARVRLGIKLKLCLILVMFSSIGVALAGYGNVHPSWGISVGVAVLVVSFLALVGLEAWVDGLKRCPECGTSLVRLPERAPSCPFCGLPLTD